VVGVTSDAVIWHDVECAAYDLDLALWRELAERADGPVLDIGAGTGRVAIDLARHGYEVTAIDADPELVHELSARARKRNLRVRTATADARSFELSHEYARVLVGGRRRRQLQHRGDRSVLGARQLDEHAQRAAPRSPRPSLERRRGFAGWRNARGGAIAGR